MQPADIVADRTEGTLSIVWEDGHVSVLALSTLRWNCPCAICAGEWGRPGQLAGLTSLPPDELALADIRLVGSYGLTPAWRSGHASGIYSFEYLRSMCPCEHCRLPEHRAADAPNVQQM